MRKNILKWNERERKHKQKSKQMAEFFHRYCPYHIVTAIKD